jgi:hypothetical protein
MVTLGFGFNIPYPVNRFRYSVGIVELEKDQQPAATGMDHFTALAGHL